MPTYNKITLNGTTLIDLSTDTVAVADDIASGKVGHLNTGATATGTHSGGIGEVIFSGSLSITNNTNIWQYLGIDSTYGSNSFCIIFLQDLYVRNTEMNYTSEYCIFLMRTILNDRHGCRHQMNMMIMNIILCQLFIHLPKQHI